MNAPDVAPITAGLAYRVTIIGPQQAEAYENVHAILDGERGVVHVFDRDARLHYLTIPLAAALIEWKEPSPLNPRPRLPPFGPGAFEHFGEHMQRMAQEMSEGFGPG
ncbi:MAG: hypothetical protein KY464_01910 [Gemmatimonadetes bacterium]|nr:hypothetical protein [Gemmatimonadota bacterium]